jgi:hypothetical protein
MYPCRPRKLGELVPTAFLFTVLILMLSASVAADIGKPGVSAELSNSAHLSLHVTLRSGSQSSVKLTRSKLPWATSDSMVIMAAVAGGSCIEKEHLIDDPTAIEIILTPNESMSGDIDLERMFPKLKQVSRLGDVQLFWAYEAPEALQIGRWSGGWILIPKQK